MSLFKKHKIQKIVLGFICYFCFSIFVALVLGGFFQYLKLEQTCNANFPYLGCQYLPGTIISIFVVLLVMIIPFITMGWLFRQSAWKLCGIIFISILSLYLGGLILKKNYVQPTTNPE